MVSLIEQRGNRRRPADHDREKHKQRNKAERIFRKLRGYHAVATRYDEPATMFLGSVLGAVLAISFKCTVNTP